MERTIGEETIRGLGVPFALLVVDDEVENRANRGGSGAAGAAAGGDGDTVATKDIGAEGTGFPGPSLFFLRRKPAMETGLGGCEKRRWIEHGHKHCFVIVLESGPW